MAPRPFALPLTRRETGSPELASSQDVHTLNAAHGRLDHPHSEQADGLEASSAGDSLHLPWQCPPSRFCWH